MNQIKAGAVLNYVIIGLNAIIGLLYTPFMLRCLGQNEYGLYSLVASIIAYLTLLDFGFGPAVVRYIAKYRAEGKKKEQESLCGLFLILYSIIGLLSFGIGLLLYFNIDWLFDNTMTSEDINQAKIMVILLLINLALTFPLSIFGSLLSAYEKFIFQKSVQIGKIVLSTIVLIVVLLMGYKAIAMVVVQTVFNISLLLCNFLYCKTKLKIKIKFKGFNLKLLKEILGFSIWVFLSDLMVKFYWNAAQFILGTQVSPSEVALFSLAVVLMQMYLMFSNGISGVLLPRITAMVSHKSSNEDIASVFLRVGRLQFFVLALVCGGFFVFGKAFVNLWAGPEFSSVFIITLICFLSTMIPLIQSTGIIILQARNQQQFRSLMLFAIGLISVIFQLWFSRLWGAIGCAMAVGGANIIGQGIILNFYYQIKQKLCIPKFWIEILKMSVGPIILTIIGYIIFNKIGNSNDYLSLICGILIYSICYLIIGWKITLNKQEKDFIINPLRSIIKYN